MKASSVLEPVAVMVYNILAKHGLASHFTVIGAVLRGTYKTTTSDQLVLMTLNKYPNLFEKWDIGVYFLKGKNEGRTYSTIESLDEVI